MRPPPDPDDPGDSVDPGDRVQRFRAVYTDAYPDLLRFAARRVHPSHAEDVVADVFLVAWRRLDDVPSEPDAARAWLFGTARRILLNERRGSGRREALAVRLADRTTTDVRDGALDADAVAGRVDLARAWDRLAATDQEVIALTAWDGLDSRRAATVLGITAVAYRLRLSRARRSLRRLLEDSPAVGSATARPLPNGHRS